MHIKILSNAIIWLSALAAILMMLHPPDTVSEIGVGIHTIYPFLFGDYLLDIQWGRLILELLIPLLIIVITILTMKVSWKRQD
ncbi:hypothetical protein CCAX7_59890 [Capsulimonas corticalis]|uniref:Uncharacterized protein n=1 Tax=Capsulimonas corticalis TaxID=2219043 RepID=A0A402CZJ2_9BACT|nr:hypothetical protein [Capsulimonas corticalis]BDI33938.1 hypothetical protein CCAX7_59890 [Capsulimonas corticalis]